jgi:hypothetical protein
MSARTPRDVASDGALVVLALGVVGVAVVCAWATHYSCGHPPPPVLRPDPGTPRAGFCGAVDVGVPWVAALIAGGVAAVGLWATRGRDQRWSIGVAIVLWVVSGAVVIAAAMLPAALTI